MSEEQFDFENLKVYQRALDYIDFVYKITKTFPSIELSKMLSGPMKSFTKKDTLS